MTITLSTQEVNLIIAGLIICVVAIPLMFGIVAVVTGKKWHKPRKEKKDV